METDPCLGAAAIAWCCDPTRCVHSEAAQGQIRTLAVELISSRSLNPSHACAAPTVFWGTQGWKKSKSSLTCPLQPEWESRKPASPGTAKQHTCKASIGAQTPALLGWLLAPPAQAHVPGHALSATDRQGKSDPAGGDWNGLGVNDTKGCPWMGEAGSKAWGGPESRKAPVRAKRKALVGRKTTVLLLPTCAWATVLQASSCCVFYLISS